MSGFARAARPEPPDAPFPDGARRETIFSYDKEEP